MNTFITYILPLLLGGIIGYVTNALAIRMLFRPFEEKYILGMRVPFTPGILPRERLNLADSLGDIVSNNLLTEDVLRGRLESEEFQRSVARAIRASLDKILDSPVSTLRGMTSNVDPIFSEAAQRAYRNLSSDAAFTYAAAATVQAALSAAESVRIRDILAPEGRSALAEWFRQPGRTEETSEKAGQAVFKALARAAEEGKSLGDLLPLENLSHAAGAAFDAAYPGFIVAARSFLAREDVRRELERYGASIVRGAVARLSPLQRLFISATQYEKAILESMPATVADLTAAAESFLAGDTIRGRFRTQLLEGIQGAIDTPLASRPATHALSADKLSDLARRAVKAIGEEQSKREKPAALEGTLGDLLDSLGPEAKDGIAKALGSWLSGLIAPGAGGGVVGAIASTFPKALVEGLGEKTIGAATGLDGEFRDRLARTLAEKGIELASREAAGILKSVDVGSIVTDKINSFDMGEVEALVMRVASKELRGITMLGGVLGVFIGALQLLVGLIKP